MPAKIFDEENLFINPLGAGKILRILRMSRTVSSTESQNLKWTGLSRMGSPVMLQRFFSFVEFCSNPFLSNDEK